MFRVVREVWRYIIYFAGAKKVWSWPRQSDVLIYDVSGYEALFEHLHSWNPEFLHVRNEFINVPVLLVSIFRRGKKIDAYTDCFIEKVRPKLVVTYIDNNINFYTISHRHASVKTMLIQNGARTYYEDVFELLDGATPESIDAMAVDYMMLFGTNVGARFSRFIKGNVIPIGSLKNNMLPTTHIRQTNVVAFVSQWRKSGFSLNGIFQTHESFFRQADKPIIQFLLQYAHEKKKRLTIILVNNKDASDRDDEEAYFRELVGEDVVFLEPVGAYSSYQAIDMASVVVGVDSTLIYEAAARGAKTAFFSIRSNLLGIKGRTFGWPSEFLDDGPFWTNHPSVEIFERIIDHLFEIDDAQWHAQLAEHSFDKVMTYDPGNGILKSILTKELGSTTNL